MKNKQNKTSCENGCSAPA